MSVQSLSIPQKIGETQSYLIQPAQDAVESAITAGKVTFETKKIKTFTAMAYETTNQAVIASILDVVRNDMVQGVARGSEKAIISGDTTSGSANINGTLTATDVRMAFKGLRAYALGGSPVDFIAGADSTLLGKLRDLRKSMGIYGMNPNDIVIVAPVSFAYRLLNIPEVITVDKYGMNATILTGELMKIDGISVIASEHVPETLTAAGVDGGALTTVLMVNKRYFGVAGRGGVALEEQKDIKSGTMLHTAFRYVDMQRLYSENKVCVAGINVAK
jgi:HK97 family phage major capsid protein